MSTQAHIVPSLIRASAGSGKTYRLSNQFIGLLIQNVPPREILASTFTRKAAGEILDRVLERLATAAISDAATLELATALGQPGLQLSDVQRFVGELARNIHELQITTLDGFFARLATAFAFELGLPPGWGMVDATEMTKLRREAIRRTLSGDPTDMVRLIRTLEKGASPRGVSDQIDAVAKYLHSYYVESDEAAWQGVETGPVVSAAEITELSRALANLTLPTHKSIVASVQNDIGFLATADYKTMIGKGYCKAIAAGKDSFNRNPITDEIREVYDRVLALAKSSLLRRLNAQTQGSFELLEHYDRELQKLKIERRSLYFDDIARVLENQRLLGELQDVFYRIDTRIQHVLLDEFQDTSRSQWNILRPLVTEVSSGTEEHSSLIVGDEKQAIYGWRGGESDIFARLHEQLPSLSIEQLHKSYRSSPAILEAVNRVFDSLSTNKALADRGQTVARWSRGFTTHEAAKSELPGHVGLHVAFDPEEGETQAIQTQRDAALLVQSLLERHRGGQIAMLFQRHATLARAHFELGKLGIEASEEGGIALARSTAVQLLLSLLRLADHPGDRVSHYHLLRSPLAELLKFKDPLDPGDADRLSRRLRTQLLRHGYAETLQTWAQELAQHCDSRSATRLAQLIDRARVFDERTHLRTSDFVRWIEETTVEDSDSDCVRLMTVHGAKGLEFPIVVLSELDRAFFSSRGPALLIGREDRRDAPVLISANADAATRALSPQLQELHDQSQDEILREQLSVLYVAMTRAAQGLHLVVAPQIKEKISGSPAGILRAALVDGEPLEAGDGHSIAGDPEFTLHDEGEAAPRRKARAIVAQAPKRRRGSAHESPSGREGGVHIEAASLLSLADDTPRRRGLAIHSCFELIAFHEDGLPDASAVDLAIAAASGEADPAQSAQWRDQFLDYARGDACVQRLARARYEKSWGDDVELELWRERDFAVRVGGVLLRGQFDRVVLGRSGGKIVRAEVLDYKSDRIPSPAALDEKIEYYRPQMFAYADAIARRCNIQSQQVELTLLFLDADRAIELKRETTA